MNWWQWRSESEMCWRLPLSYLQSNADRLTVPTSTHRDMTKEKEKVKLTPVKMHAVIHDRFDLVIPSECVIIVRCCFSSRMSESFTFRTIAEKDKYYTNRKRDRPSVANLTMPKRIQWNADKHAGRREDNWQRYACFDVSLSTPTREGWQSAQIDDSPEELQQHLPFVAEINNQMFRSKWLRSTWMRSEQLFSEFLAAVKRVQCVNGSLEKQPLTCRVSSRNNSHRVQPPLTSNLERSSSSIEACWG